MGDLEVIGNLEGQLGSALKRVTRATARNVGASENAVLIEGGRVIKLWLYGHDHVDLTRVGELTDLRELHIARCGLKSVTMLRGLRQLVELHLPVNHLSNIVALEALSNLQRLRLSRNQLEDITALGRLDQLESLCLDGNPISDLDPLKSSLRLQRLDLRRTRVTRLQPLSRLERLSVLHLPDRRPTDTPARVAAAGPRAIRDYFELRRRHGEAIRSRARVFVLGEPGAGKTTFIETCVGEPKARSPHAVDATTTWSTTSKHDPHRTIAIGFWELSGPVERQAVHRLLLRQAAAFVVLFDSRTNSSDLLPWLRMVATVDPEARVLVLTNQQLEDRATTDQHAESSNGDAARQHHQAQGHLDEAELTATFPDLRLHFLDVDLHSDDGRREVVRDRLLQEVSEETATLTEARTWSALRDQLSDLGQTQAHLTYDEYRALCRSQKLTELRDQQLLLECLHDERSVLHFGGEAPLNDLIFLRPKAAADAIQQVLTTSTLDARFTRSRLFRVWGKAVTNDDKRLFLELMQGCRFDLAYRLAPRSILSPRDVDPEYCIPELLDKPPAPQATEWEHADNLRVRYRYRYSPLGLWARLAVRLSDLVAKGGGGDLIFQGGFLVEDELARAVVRQIDDAGESFIDVAVQGPRSARQQLLRSIRRAAEQVHDEYGNPRLAELLVGCCCTSCEKSATPSLFPVEHLENQWERGQAYVTCRLNGSSTHVAIHSVLSHLLGAESAPTSLLEAGRNDAASSHSIDPYLAAQLQRDRLLELWFKTLPRSSSAYSTERGDREDDTSQSQRPPALHRVRSRSSRPPPSSQGRFSTRGSPRLVSVASVAVLLTGGYLGVLGYQRWNNDPSPTVAAGNVLTTTRQGALRPRPASGKAGAGARNATSNDPNVVPIAPDAGSDEPPSEE